MDSDFNENSFTAKKTDEGGKSVQDLLKSESGGSSPETVLSRRKKCVISDSDTTWSESATEEEEEAYVSAVRTEIFSSMSKLTTGMCKFLLVLRGFEILYLFDVLS